MSAAKFFIENYKFSMVLTFFVILFGLGGLIEMNREAFPAVDIGAASITTRYDGATAQDIETKITKPIEDEIRGVSGLKYVRSTSQAGVSVISIWTNIDDYDVKEVMTDLQRAVDSVSDLPVDLENPPQFLEVKTEEFPVIEVSVVGSNEGRLRDRVADELKEEIEDNDKVVGVTLTGFRERQFQILVDSKKLEQYYVGINEVLQQLKNRNVSIPGGQLKNKSKQKLLRLDAKAQNIEEIGNIIVRSNFSGQQVRLRDIAEILDTSEEAQTLARYEGRPATNLTIAKKSGTDLIELSTEVEKIIASYREKYKAKLEFHIYNNEGDRVRNRVSVLTSNAIVGLVLVLFFLLIFLPGRTGLMASLSLPLAVFSTFGYIATTGSSLNTMTILAIIIAIGMLVDNSVVISENFLRLINSGMNAKDAALKSIKDLWFPVTATALTTIAAFLPMLVTRGVIGGFIESIPILVSFALMFSLIECFFLLPVRLYIVHGKDKKQEIKEKKDFFDAKLLPIFNSTVQFLLQYRYLMVFVFTGMIFGSILLMTVFNRFDLFPANQTEVYISRLEMPEGTRLEVTNEKLKELQVRVREVLKDQAKHIVTKAGDSKEDFGDPKALRGNAVGLAYIYMTMDAKNSLNTQDVLKRLREIKLDGAKRLTFEAKANGPPIGDPVTVTFRSNQSESLDEVIQAVLTDLKKTKGVYDVKVDDVQGDDEVFVNLNYSLISRLGINVSQIGNTIRTAIAGLPVNDVNLDNKEVEYFVRMQDMDKTSVEDLSKLKVMDPSGNLVALSRLAEFQVEPGSIHIKRYDFKRARTVSANIETDVISSVEANKVATDTFKRIQATHPDVSMEYGGEAENTAESMQSLAQALVLSIIGIFALMVLLFKSYTKPFIILTTVPLGLVGVSVAFLVQSIPISFLSLIGVVGLGGIIVNSGIVLISFIDQMREEQPDRPIMEILVESAGMRFRAVLVTSLTTVSGLLPTAYGIGGADDFIMPMAMSMAWGLTSGTILSILWVPCAYAILEDTSRLLSREKPAMKELKASEAS